MVVVTLDADFHTFLALSGLCDDSGWIVGYSYLLDCFAQVRCRQIPWLLVNEGDRTIQGRIIKLRAR